MALLREFIMPETIVRQRIQLTARMELKDKTGRLIYSESTKGGRKYDAWGMKWCTSHRDSWTPPGFREGKINPLTLGFALIQGFRR